MNTVTRKTNLYDAFSSGLITINSSTGAVNANAVLRVGNTERMLWNEAPMTLAQILKTTNIKRFIACIEDSVRDGVYHDYLPPEKLVYVVGRGSNSTTMMFLPIALKMAALMSPRFEARTFADIVTTQPMEHRVTAQHYMIELNKAMDENLTLGTSEEKEKTYREIATIIRKKIFHHEELAADENVWRTLTTTDKHIRQRDALENILCAMLKTGVVSDIDHLKDVIAGL